MTIIDDTNIEGLILCQPDSNKGCSLCCGLFNFKDISRESLFLFLEEGRQRELFYKSYEDYTEPAEVRDRGSHICPFQGFLADDKPGCLLHPLYCGEERRGRALFSEKICGKFLCPAHYLLTEEEKEGLIKYVNDWYLYSVAVTDPLFFSQVYKKSVEEFPLPGEEDKIEKFIISMLDEKSKEMGKTGKILFSYSVSEYSFERKE
jgi:hypothetical protein